MARWSRADYEAMERVIAHRNIENDLHRFQGRSGIEAAVYRRALLDVAVDLAEMYEADNPNFDIDRFMLDCDFERAAKVVGAESPGGEWS